MKHQYMPLLPWPPGFFAQDQSRQRPQIQSWAISHRHLWCWFSVPQRFRTLKEEKNKSRDLRDSKMLEMYSGGWLWRKLTHEEVFELAFINVVWKVADKELVGVRVTDDPPALHVVGLRLTSATCRWKQPLESSDQLIFLNCDEKKFLQPQNETFVMSDD